MSAARMAQFILEGYCRGAYSVEGISEIAGEAWYQQALTLIKEERPDEALKIAEANFSAEYCVDNISKFEEYQVQYIETTAKVLANHSSTLTVIKKSFSLNGLEQTS